MKNILQKDFKGLKSRKTVFIVLGVLLSIILCSCKKVDDDQKTIFLQHEKKDVYNYSYVKRGDVELSFEVLCNYVQSRSENYTFAVKDRMIQNICVNEGEQVQKGQVLAELDNDNAEAKMKESNYIIKKNSLLIKQTQQQKDLDLKGAKDIYNASPKSSQDKSTYDNKVNEIDATYNQTIEDCKNAIEIERLKLKSYNKTIAQSKIVSGITGTVSFIKANLVGTYSDPEDDVIKVVDNTSCVYETKDVKYMKYFKDKKQIDLHVKTSDADKIYQITPTELSKWKDLMMFRVVTPNFNPKVGDNGYIYAIMGHKENVLYVDTQAVHKAKDKYYVYVRDNKGNRQMKYVTIGLKGNKTIEIVSGLKEGDKIIITMDSLWGE